MFMTEKFVKGLPISDFPFPPVLIFLTFFSLMDKTSFTLASPPWWLLSVWDSAPEGEIFADWGDRFIDEDVFDNINLIFVAESTSSSRVRLFTVL